MNIAESNIRLCKKCGFRNEPTADQCAQCGVKLIPNTYAASVSSGLKRLENEKLAFLGTGALVSKFNPSDIEKFTDIAEVSLDSQMIPEADDAALIPDDIAHTLENMDPDEILSSGTQTDVQLNPEAIFHAKQIVNLPSRPVDVGDISDIGALVAKEMDKLDDESGIHALSVALPTSSITSVDDSQTDTCLDEPLPTVTDDPAFAGDPKNHQRPDDSSALPYAQILIPAVHQKKQEQVDLSEVPAIDKLKRQGLFDPLPVHAEVSNSIEEIQNLDQILPESKLEPWQGHFESDALDEVLPVNSSKNITIPKSTLQSQPKPESESPESQCMISTPDAHALSDEEFETSKTIPIQISHPLLNPAVLQSTPNQAIPAEDVPHSSRVSDRFLLVMWIVFSFLICGGIFYLLYHMGILAKLSPMLDPYKDAPIAASSPVSGLSSADIRPAIDEASQIIEEKFQFESWLEPWIISKLAEQPAPEAQIQYLEMGLDYYPEHPQFTTQYIQSLIDAGQPRAARDFIQSLSDDVFASPQIQELYYQAFASDPVFLSPVQTIQDTDWNEIGPLGGGSTLTFKAIKDNAPYGAFKPLQKRKQSNYRAEIASWRLCELLQCDFQIPWNRPVKIEYNTFNKLYNRSKSRNRDNYRKEFKDLIWTKEAGSSYLYGTLKDWVPDHTRFPIELKSLWKDWLSQTNYIEDYPEIDKALMPISRQKAISGLYTALINQSPNLTTESLASQVSQVLTFDYMVNNWDRFSGVSEWWGVNCQFKNNHIVSIDNGAAFPSYNNDKVQERFMMVERFSDHFIRALRLMDKDKTLELLFPEPTDFEKKCFERFWMQRTAVLKRVDALSEKHGADRVLSFY